jgi:hypothetical protein
VKQVRHFTGIRAIFAWFLGADGMKVTDTNLPDKSGGKKEPKPLRYNFPAVHSEVE